MKPLTASFLGSSSDPLLILPDNTPISHATGSIPLLVDFTFEDKAAKGLRKRSGSGNTEPPVHFSALEVVRDNRVLLLEGPSGCGKTTFARDLCFRFRENDQNGDGVRRVIRNKDGHVLEERWDCAKPRTVVFDLSAEKPEAGGLKSFVSGSLPGILESAEEDILLILDGIETAGNELESPVLLRELVARAQRHQHLRLLILADSTVSQIWTVPAEIVRHRILPLLQAQRKATISHILGDVASEKIALGAAAANPAVFALALQAGVSGEIFEDVIDSWLEVVIRDGHAIEHVAERAWDRVVNGGGENSSALAEGAGAKAQLLLSVRKVQQLLAARHLAELPMEVTVRFFQWNPLTAEAVVSSVLARLESNGRGRPSDLAKELLRSKGSIGQRGALLVSSSSLRNGFDHLLREELLTHMLAIINEATLSISERTQAGRVLSHLCDPRNLSALADVPGGTFTLGSTSHPNSLPQAPATVPSFRIGIYPVVNRDYALFIRKTGRKWLSPDGFDPERQNAPATDLSWHDARAYCAWVTERWRSDGTIGASSQVRLPTEPEWERACTGDENVYPWGLEWRENAANSEEAGLNATCAVGLFPAGLSPYGCYDMAGQVWEWCSTLWGEEMSKPSFGYPYRSDDGREDFDAPGGIRRVLRGGCFSSGKLKACGTYRGSLEPGGSWRGNGFRVVVAAV
ncbi:C-type lectin protein [Aspergillus stella-maris]|uniref:C-type lectin protein n=1 Tax=Aspergillus stella-maris TaxID=1810926 RepID=UPI003CCD8EA8